MGHLRDLPGANPDQVKKANREFYDLAAGVYEAVDGRRGEAVSRWLDRKLRDLSLAAGSGALLDIGCGTGFVLRKAAPWFPRRVGVDISLATLKLATKDTELVCCADNDYLPFGNARFGVVTCLAVLHHMPRHEALFREIFRVLGPGGLFYSDHDLDARFNRVWNLPLRLYRAVRKPKMKYIQACPALTEELYDYAEIHEEGIEVTELVDLLKDAGFREVKVRYHWTGLGGVFNAVQKLAGEQKSFPRGFAPSFSLMARKPG